MAIIATGPMANILVAIGIYAGIFTIQGMSIFLPIVSSVVPGSPVAVAGFQPGDRIVAADHIPIANFDALRPILEGHPGQKLRCAVDRRGVVLYLSATLDSKPAGSQEVGYFGIWSNVAARQKMGLGQAVVTVSQRTWRVSTQTLQGFGRVLTTGQGASNFRGVIGVAHLAGQAAAAGVDTLLTLMAILSVNLALMNLFTTPYWTEALSFAAFLNGYAVGRPPTSCRISRHGRASL